MAYSLTLFKSIYDNKTQKRMDFTTWKDFEKLLYELSEVERKSKKSASLISPAIYLPGTTRSNKNVIEWASWAAIDVDDHDFKGNLQDELYNRYGNWYYVCYSTASSTDDHPKFRLVFPLENSVSGDRIRSFWYALNKELDTIGDLQCKDLSRMYYIPAKYAGANNFIFTNASGRYISPDTLIQKHKVNKLEAVRQSSKTFLDRLPEEIQNRIIEQRKSSCTDTNVTWNSYRDCPFVNKSLIGEYISIANVDNSGRYRMIYKIMVSIAANAIKKKYPITPDEISGIIRELDSENGSRYKKRSIEKEADRAIEFAYRNI